MNKINMSQRLNARMQFKSLLMLTLLAGSASAQQSPVSLPTMEAAPAVEGIPADVESLRSTWTLRQHATWLLGLKPRQVMTHAAEPCLPTVPQIDMISSVNQLTPAFPSQLPEVPVGELLLVQHTEPISEPAAESVAEPISEQAAEPIAEAAPPQLAPPSLNLGPVVSGPVPALPLEQLADESLLQVDLSGVDVAKLAPPVEQAEPLEAESLIEGLGFTLPVSFSMRDGENEAASLAASPAHATPVSIHEGFAPRMSTANQAAQLSGESRLPASGRLNTSGPGPSHFSMSDKPDAPASGAILNRLSDKETVQAKLDDRDAPALGATNKPVEKSFTDKGSIFASVPVEVSSDSDKTSRSGKPVVLTPPNRLAQVPPRALPLSSATPIASTGIEGETTRAVGPAITPSTTSSSTASPTLSTVARTTPGSQTPVVAHKSSTEKSGLEKSSTDKPSTDNSSADNSSADKPSAEKPGTDKASTSLAKTDSVNADKTASQVEPVDKQASERLIEGLVTTPSLLVATEPAIPSEETVTKSTPPRLADKPLKIDSALTKATPSKPERVTLSDFNPLAMKRPVVKAANVAIPEVTDPASVVVPSSHEVDETSRQTAEYAKMAAKMQQAVKQKFPTVRVKVTCNEDGLIVDGNLLNNSEASKVLSFIRKTSLCPVADRLTTSQ